MKLTISSIALMCVIAAATGCAARQNRQATQPPAGGVAELNIPSATPPATFAAPAAAPVGPAQPVIYDAPATAAPAAAAVPAAASSGASSGAGGAYTVRKGDTLWKIAATQYGDGKQWQRIASANPGLAPATLKAGQTITLP